MKVKILVTGPYADYTDAYRTGKVRSKQHKEGDIADFPPDYALALIEQKIAEAVPEVVEVSAREVVLETKPELAKEWRGEIKPEADPKKKSAR